MFTLGVTGGIGSGKTLVSNMLAEMGARVFNADAEARRIMQEDPIVAESLVEMFGPKAFHEGGELNRRHIASLVFAQPEMLDRLNALVHPRVFASFMRECERARADGVDILVHEAALIFEAGGEAYMDAVAVVDAPVEARIARVVERDHVSPDDVRARMRHQLPAEELVRRADYVITNDGAIEDLRQKVRQLADRIRSLGLSTGGGQRL